MKTIKSRAWRWGAASLALALGNTGVAVAQEMAAADLPITTAEDIVVQAEIEYRNRVEGPAPVLEYGLDYFQRFEPRTVGDMLKRTPSAAFAGSDMGEFDDLQIRGLGAGYTQILIDGERVPGSGFDRTFFVDRIPAELVERVEIVRSPSANRSGDAVAGALNIVMRDAMTFDGGYIRAGALHYDDNETEGSLAGVWGGSLGGDTRVLLGASYQGRHNPKDKFSQRFTTPPGGTHWDGDPPFELQNTEVQSDVRDGEDYTFNGSLFLPIGEGQLELSGVYVRTDREEIEDSFEFDDGGDLETLVPGWAHIQQDNINLQADFEHPFMGGELEIDLGYAIFDEDSLEGETETGVDGGGLIESLEGEEEAFNFTDEELSFSIAQHFDLNDDLQVEFGIDWNSKERDGLLTAREFEFDDGGGSPIGDAPPFTGDPWTEADEVDGGTADGGDFLIEERRLDPYLMFSGEGGPIEWEAGLRYETTEIDVTDRDEALTESHEYEALLPSAHVRFNITQDDRLNLSVARSVRRPSFRFIMPSLFEGEFGDNDFQGNASLDPETAWGADLGWERRLGRVGVVGINVFYRDVTDVLEVFNTGELTEDYTEDLEEFLDDNPGLTEDDFFAEEPPVFIYSARNTGDGQVWGVEFDLSTPLTFIGMENTGVFLNYSWLDSEIEDEFSTRRFNNQAEDVLNIGFIHDMPAWGAAFGATYRQQGDAFTRVLGEEVNISYGGDLEVFVEKRFGENFSLRFTGSNLLDASKDEVYDVFLNEDHQSARLYDEFELETEATGPVYQVVARYAF